MPAPTKQVSAVTPSRSGMPGGALSAWIVYVSLFSSSARTPAHGTATFPDTTTRGLPGRDAKWRPSSSTLRVLMTPIIPRSPTTFQVRFG